ncbi:MAG: hypothetical protein H6812_02490 [Phycisphaeraceae bacterium]|nr:hypothetical protein [Phycisphaeraceae bacterium]
MKSPVWAIGAYVAGVVFAGAVIPGAGERGVAAVAGPVMCRGELRSWVVAGRGRHLYLDVECPEPYAYLSGRIEFGGASLREDYRAPEDRAYGDRVSRMTRGVRLMPPAGIGFVDNRLEAVFELTLEQVACLQRDRMWSARYVLVGANSNSAMLATLGDCDCEAPARVIGGAGLFGEFPGVDAELGDEIEAGRWARYGVAGPTEALPDVGFGDE